MINFPTNPHAIIEVGIEKTDSKTKKKSFELVVIYDSWEQKNLFKDISVELTTDMQSQVVWKIFDPNYKLINFFTQNNAVKTFVFRVFLGFGAELGEPVFKGLLANVERDLSDTVFTAYDMGFKMKQTVKAGYFNKKTDLQIIKLLAERNGLLFSPPEKPLNLEPHRAMMQDEQTDWQHAQERARDAGLLLFVRQDTLFARYPAKLTAPKLLLEYRKQEGFSDYNLTFRTPENEGVRPKIVKFRGRGKGGRRLEGKSDKSQSGRENVILKRDIARASKAGLSRRAQAQKELDKEHAFEGFVKFPFIYPDIRLDVRDTISLRGIGDLFSQDYICDTVSYDFSAGRLDVDVEIYRDYLNK